MLLSMMYCKRHSLGACVEMIFIWQWWWLYIRNEYLISLLELGHRIYTARYMFGFIQLACNTKREWRSGIFARLRAKPPVIPELAWMHIAVW